MERSNFHFILGQSYKATKTTLKKKSIKSKTEVNGVDNDIVQALAPPREGQIVYKAVAAANESNRNGWYKLNVGGITFVEYVKNPIILMIHNGSRFPIGRAVKVYFEDQKSKLIIEFVLSQVHPDAVLAAQLIEEGILKAVSVGLHILETVETNGDDVPMINKSELLELSVVSVPADSDALITEARESGGVNQEYGDDDVSDIETMRFTLEQLTERIEVLESKSIDTTTSEPEESSVTLDPELESQINAAFDLTPEGE